MKYFLSLLLIVVIAGGLFGYLKYQAIFSPNVPSELSDPFVLIPSNSTFDDVVENLDFNGFISNRKNFEETAKLMSYDKAAIRHGRFQIQPNWSSRELIQHLRSGKQATVKVVLTNERLPHEIAGKVAKAIVSDSLALLTLFRDEAFLKKHNTNAENFTTYIIPNTYDFYWNTSPEKFMERMFKEHDKFWSANNRKAKAKDLGLTPEEVYTLASIVERESNYNPEKPRIAGVYLNRIKKGMLLQADPTAVFATKDFGARRVLNKHIQFDSPYNTYMYPGLPPGPICMASIPSIDAVLTPEDHKYIYFCAKPDDTGQHSFATTLAGHNANANKFRRWLSKRGIRR